MDGIVIYVHVIIPIIVLISLVQLLFVGCRLFAFEYSMLFALALVYSSCVRSCCFVVLVL